MRSFAKVIFVRALTPTNCMHEVLAVDGQFYRNFFVGLAHLDVLFSIGQMT